MTAYDFPGGAHRLSLLLRLWPEPFTGQSISHWEVTVNDAPVRAGPRNGYGERTALWTGSGLDGALNISASGSVECENRAGVVAGLTSRIEPAVFLRATRRTRADRAIRELGGGAPGSDRLTWLHGLMADVRSRIAYQSGTTTMDTSAADALAAGSGVCQDQAHAFIAAARAHGIPARYVVGYLHAAEEQFALHETHAWAEAWLEGLGWVGFDPSNGVCPTERYVRLCTGFDAVDAAPIRGHASGGGALGLYADVRITPGEAPLLADRPIDVAARDLQTRIQQQ